MGIDIDHKIGKISHPYLWLGALTLLAAAIRFHNLGSDSFWFDEILTLNSAQSGFRSAFTVRDHPPLLYLLSSLSIQTLGTSEATLRLISMLAGTASVALLGWWGIIANRDRAGLWAALLLAFSPFHLRYSQEARPYALLMLFSLLTVICLYLAMIRVQWRWWIAFAFANLLNLYTHYGATLVLLAAAAVILIWLIRRRSWQDVRYPLLSALIVLLGYAPWFSRFWSAFGGNRGVDAAVGTTGITPLSVWLLNAYNDFGFRTYELPALALILFLAGLVVLIRQKDWPLFNVITLFIGLPFFLIWSLQIARYGFAKYIIYMLPLYLMSIAVAVDRGLYVICAKLPAKQAYPVASAASMLVVMLLLTPLLFDEYDYVERDWRNAVQSIAPEIKAGDVFLPINLDLPDGFNQGRAVLPYYLDQVSNDYIILDGNRLKNLDDVLSGAPGNVWIFALNRVVPMPIGESSLATQEFPGKLFVIRSQGTSIDDQLKAAYNYLVPLAVSPSPRCIVAANSAKLSGAVGEWDEAAAILSTASQLCPERDKGYAELQYTIDKGRLPLMIEAGQTQEAVRIAYRLWQQDAKDEDVLGLLTVFDLMQQFEEGSARVKDNDLPEPVNIRRFTMPHNGDWGDVLFIHPPAEVDFDVILPESPTNFYTRLAMAPESWEFGGDGATFVVSLTTSDGSRHELLRKHISNEPADQDWHPITIPLDAFSGQEVTITLTTEPGPKGDSTGDWAGFEVPRILWRP